MQSPKSLLTLIMTILLTVPSALAQLPQRSNPSAQDVTIIIQQQQVRFTAPSSVEQIQFQVFDQSGELVFDSQPRAVNQLDWPTSACRAHCRVKARSTFNSQRVTVRRMPSRSTSAEA